MDGLLKKIDDYYTKKLALFGATASGVDWKNEESQQLRFDQLVRIIAQENFSVLDYGCGYGALYEYLALRKKQFQYVGYDISQQMVTAAIKKNNNAENAFFTTEQALLNTCDYSIASGIFNVKLDTSVNEWEEYVFDTLSKMNELSTKGFSFNMLPFDCDEAYKKDYLYYADYNKVVEKCKKINKGKGVVKLVQHYSLYEFTVLVNKI